MYNGSQSIEARVKEVLADILCIHEEIKSDAHLVDDLGADSLDLVESLMDLEDEFGMEIPDGIAETWSTVQNVIDSVTALINK